MKMKMKNLVFYGLFLVLFIPFGIYMQKKVIKDAQKHFAAFNAADINQRIESIGIEFKGTGIKLSDGRRFVFYPITHKILNERIIFEHMAEKGDRVEKKAFSDTLYLYKGDKVLWFTFFKF